MPETFLNQVYQASEGLSYQKVKETGDQDSTKQLNI